MATFVDHIEQSKRNVVFLSKINSTLDNCWDWQVTVCFYTALHLINAHIASKTNSNYLSHYQVEKIINPFNDSSPACLDDNVYKSYTKLFQLSRRSRYLVGENNQSSGSTIIQPGKSTHSLHLRKSIHHLDLIIDFVKLNYSVEFPNVEIVCKDLNGLTFKNFQITN
jgi:hypothetical protein